MLGKQSVYEHALGCPLVVAGPGIPHGETAALTYLYDLMPTLLDEAGVEVPAGVEGQSLRPVWEGGPPASAVRVPDVREQDARRQRRRWKLIRYPLIAREQLFDLDADPDELVDLAQDPSHRDRRAALRTLLEREHSAAATRTPSRSRSRGAARST